MATVMISIDNPLRQTLGERLRKARKNRDLTEEQLAQLVGISRGSVSSYERDITRPNRAVLREWANVTGVKPEQIDVDGVISSGCNFDAPAQAA